MKKIITALLLLTTITSCTSSGDDGGFDFTGNWTGNLSLRSGTCEGSVSNQVSINQDINQMGEDIELKSGDIEFTGSKTSDNAFNVTAKRDLVIGTSSNCKANYTFEYKDAVDNTADVTFTTNVKCDDNSDCTVTYTGSSKRTAS